MHDDIEAPRWVVNMHRRSDGGMDLRLFIDDQCWLFPPLEAHKLGSALHAAAMPELERQDGVDQSFTDLVTGLLPPDDDGKP